jgi:iron complex outermembrane receptor protein
VRGFYPVQYQDGLQSPVGSVSSTGIDLWGFDTIEILKGPSSTLYGFAPPGGIINLTSRRPQDNFGGEVQVLGGSYDDKQIAGDVTGPITDTLDYRLTGLYYDRGTQTDDVYSRRYYVAPALTWKIAPHTSITFLADYQFDKILNDGQGFLPAFGTLLHNPDGQLSPSTNLGQQGYNFFRREQWSFGYDLKHAFTDSLKFEQNLKYFGDLNSALQVYGAGLVSVPYGFTGSTLPAGEDSSEAYRNNFPFDEHIHSFNVDNRLTAKFDTGPVRNTFLLGVDYRNYILRSAFGFSSGPDVDIYDPAAAKGVPVVTPPIDIPYTSVQQAQTGLYFQDQAKLGGFIFTGGGREDFVRQSTGDDVDKFTYRVGGNYIFPSGLAPYVSYATSFQPLPGYNPTTGDQVEGGVKFQPRFLPHGYNILATAAIFDLHQNNVLAPDLGSATPQVEIQIGQVHVAGAELETVAHIHEQLAINFSYSYLFSKASAAIRQGGPNTPADLVGTYNTDPPVFLTPRNKASLLADYTFAQGPLKGFGLGAGVRYTGATFGDLAGEWRDPSYVLWDGLLHYNFQKWRLQVDLSNMFNKTYIAQCSSYSDCYYGLQRKVQASLTRAF